MNNSKQFSAFLSFADPDRELVKALNELFWQMREPTYFAPVELPRTGTPEWRKEIINGIKNSYSFVPIYSRHSIKRPWVLYESGVADFLQLPRYPARVSSINISDIDYLPSEGTLVYDLFDVDSLVQLCVNVCLSKGGNQDEVTAKVERVVRQSSITKKIITISKTRWVFIAGNTPNDEKVLSSQIGWYKNKTEFEEKLKKFVNNLTETLLDEGFSISACPQVPSVGMHIINKAVNCIATKKYLDPVDFRIAGLYPIDREARELKLQSEAKQHWLDHIMDFRRSYMDDQEWLILIGGNEGTYEEYLAATETKTKIFSIPCFGGTAKEVWDKEVGRVIKCKDCLGKDGQCGKEEIEKIIKFLKEFTS